ncbi:MAG: hypothetical protein IIW88_06820, partial [Clostridia bacterium]|nr:hypothetical protein [Clostridia bacterium]
PLSYYPIKFVLMVTLVGCLRFAYRILRVFHGKGLGAKKNQRKNVMIIHYKYNTKEAVFAIVRLYDERSKKFADNLVIILSYSYNI